MADPSVRDFIEKNYLTPSRIDTLNNDLLSISATLQTNGGSYVTGDLPSLLNLTALEIGNNGVATMSYDSLWRGGPFGFTNLSAVLAISNVLKGVGSYNYLQLVGDQIFKIYPDDQWIKDNYEGSQSIFDNQFITPEEETNGLSYYTKNNPNLTIYMLPQAVYPTLQSTSVLQFDVDGGFNNSGCSLFDYDKTANTVNYDCGATKYIPLNLNNCSPEASGGNKYKIWISNASGLAGDNYLACDDTLVADQTGATMGSSGISAKFSGSAQHPGCFEDEKPGYTTTYGCGETSANVDNTFTILGIFTSGDTIQSILSQTPGSSYDDLHISGDTLYDTGSNYIYAALVKLSRGATFELMHNFLGTNGSKHDTNDSEVYIRCPLGFISDCRSLFNTPTTLNAALTQNQPILIHGYKYWLSRAGDIYNLNNYTDITTSDFASGSWGNMAQMTNLDSAVDLPAITTWVDSLPPLARSEISSKYSLDDYYGAKYFMPGGFGLKGYYEGAKVMVSRTLGYLLNFDTATGKLDLLQCSNDSCTKGIKIWESPNSSAGSGGYVEFDLTGNLVIYNSSSSVIWSSGTANRGKKLELRLDGNLVITDASNNIIWSTDTAINNQSLNGWVAPNYY